MTKIFFYPILLVAIFAGVSCKQAVVTNPPSQNTVEFLQSDSRFKILTLALSTFHLDSLLISGSNIYTLFAPTDEGFVEKGYTLDSIKRIAFKSAGYDTLAYILKNHIVLGQISGINLVARFSQMLTSLNDNFQPTIAKTFNGIFIDGIKVIFANVPVAHGGLQIITHLATPPLHGTVYDLLHARGDLTYTAALTDILKLAEIATKNLPLTLLVTTDSAWRTYGFTNIDEFKLAVKRDTVFFANVFFTGIGAPTFSNQFIGDPTNAQFGVGGSAESGLGGFDGSKLDNPFSNLTGFGCNFTLDGRHVDQGAGLPTPSIIEADILGTNGTIDVLDGVINPSQILTVY